MKNQQTHQTETSVEQEKRENGRKGLSMAGLVLGIIATAFTIIWLMAFADAPSSRLSNPSEITAQKKFQDELITAQEGFQQKIDAVRKEAEQKSDSILKAAEQK